jgi:hypothetical protein
MLCAGVVKGGGRQIATGAEMMRGMIRRLLRLFRRKPKLRVLTSAELLELLREGEGLSAISARKCGQARSCESKAEPPNHRPFCVEEPDDSRPTLR